MIFVILWRSHVFFEYFYIKLDILQLHFAAIHFITICFFRYFSDILEVNFYGILLLHTPDKSNGK